jgi:hypothetical protein
VVTLVIDASWMELEDSTKGERLVSIPLRMFDIGEGCVNGNGMRIVDRWAKRLELREKRDYLVPLPICE